MGADATVEVDGLGGEEAQLVLVAGLERVEDGGGQTFGAGGGANAGRRVDRRHRPARAAVVREPVRCASVSHGSARLVGAEDHGKRTVELRRRQRLLHHRRPQPGPQRGAVHQVEVLERVAGVDQLAGGDLETSATEQVGEAHDPVEERARASDHHRAL